MSANARGSQGRLILVSMLGVDTLANFPVDGSATGME